MLESNVILNRMVRNLRRVWACSLKQCITVLAVVCTLLGLGGSVAWYKLDLVREIRHVGHADEAAYAEMGRALVAGRGFNVRHVSVFFIPYDPGIERREDHWPPLMGMLIAPFIWWHGLEAWAAKIPAILVGSVVLPLAAAALAMALSQRAWPGLLAGLCMLADVTVFTESLKTLTDVTTAALGAGWLAAVIAAARWRGLNLVAGVLAAAAFYGKGSQIILLGLWPAVALLTEPWRRGSPGSLARWLASGLGVAVALISPWLIANWVQYGRPMHSTQNYAAGYIGLENWEQRFYRPHWGRDLPQVSDRWQVDPARYWRLVERQTESFTRVALLGPRAGAAQWQDMGALGTTVYNWLRPGESSRHQGAEVSEREPGWRPGRWRDPAATTCGLGAVLTVLAVLAAAIARWVWQIVHRRRGSLQHGAGSEAASATSEQGGSMPGALQGVAAVMLVGAAQWAFVVYLWEALPRLGLVFLPMSAALAAAGVSWLVAGTWRGLPERWRAQWPHVEVAATVGLCALTLVVAWSQADRLKDHHRRQVDLDSYPYADELYYPQLGDWLHTLSTEQRPEVIMCRNPWQFRFASPDEVKMVGLPYAEPGVILWIARYYGVTHYLRDRERSGMSRYLNGRHPAFVRVPGAPAELYRIDWSRLSPQELVPPHDRATLP